MPVFDCNGWLGGSVVPGAAPNAAVIAASLQARSIDSAMLMSAHARRVDPVAGNRILRAMVEQSPHLYACLTAHTNRVDSSIAAMRELMPTSRFIAMALVGLRDGEPVRKFVADEILNAYRRFGKPILLQAYDARAVEAGLEIAKAYPVLRFVFLGMGGAEWRTAISAAHTSTNIVLEISGALDRAKLPAAVEVLGPHRLLFGSGFPATDPVAILGLVEDSDVSEETRQRILWENASRLFAVTA